jgi:AraC family transcriptional regulator of adaptative response/methylated-DNA-[protein]-cysteine methyltransferase
VHVNISRLRTSLLGTIQVAGTFQGLVRVQLDDDGDRLREELRRTWPGVSFKRGSAMTVDAGRVLRAYLQGGADPGGLPIVLPEVGFRTRVWRALQRIPHGQVRTYGGIARGVRKPRAARAVGQACGANPLPLIVPCHRVVAADRYLGGYTGGVEIKRLLLDLEGIEYRA